MKKTLSFILLALAALTAQATDYSQSRDIPYRTAATGYAAQRCKLDIYQPVHTDKKSPAVVWFHGGGLEGGEKFIPSELQNKDIAIIAVNYRLLPKAKIQDIIDDAAASIAWTFAHADSLGIDPAKIYIAGHSAGGYLTNMIVLDTTYLAKYHISPNQLAGAFPFSGQVITHFNVRREQGIGQLTPIIDNTAPLYYVRKLPIPLILISGDRNLELYGRYEEQAYFWRMMQLHGNTQCHIYELQGYDHGNMPEAGHKIMLDYIWGRKK